MIDSCYERAKEVLKEEFDFLHYLADMLLINETLDSEEMEIVYECTQRKRVVHESKE